MLLLMELIQFTILSRSPITQNIHKSIGIRSHSGHIDNSHENEIILKLE